MLNAQDPDVRKFSLIFIYLEENFCSSKRFELHQAMEEESRLILWQQKVGDPFQTSRVHLYTTNKETLSMVLSNAKTPKWVTQPFATTRSVGLMCVQDKT